MIVRDRSCSFVLDARCNFSSGPPSQRSLTLTLTLILSVTLTFAVAGRLRNVSKSTSPIFMKFGTNFQRLGQILLLTFQRSRSHSRSIPQ